ncbi:hypothetical protein RHMOL_Rhmol12G0143800 [Rhododendron molle]|uniref:Uncharacterized protein n=1 Tax=Rhododendron molle TaxID=49168 RepID=A0ACC0LID0_RHOML|nr:hypothetical protein RHMOL_Rhmol12G0143800 [Rhododendron molle]
MAASREGHYRGVRERPCGHYATDICDQWKKTRIWLGTFNTLDVSAVEATSTAAEGDDSGASEGGAPHVSEQGKQWRRPSIGFLLLAARPGTSGMHGIKAGKKQYNHKCKTGIFSSLPRNGRIVWILNLAEGMADSSLELENFYLLVLKLYVEVVLSHSRRLYFCSCGEGKLGGNATGYLFNLYVVTHDTGKRYNHQLATYALKPKINVQRSLKGVDLKELDHLGGLERIQGETESKNRQYSHIKLGSFSATGFCCFLFGFIVDCCLSTSMKPILEQGTTLLAYESCFVLFPSSLDPSFQLESISHTYTPLTTQSCRLLKNPTQIIEAPSTVEEEEEEEEEEEPLPEEYVLIEKTPRWID